MLREAAQSAFSTIAYGKKHYFLITALGQMGTFWLASQLNKHPSIFCTHAYDKPLWGATGAPLTGEEGERQRSIIKTRLGTLKLRHFLNEHAQATNKYFVGNVHAYNVDQVVLMKQQESMKSIRVVNLIRHPVSRIRSMFNCIKNEWFKEGYIDHLSFVPKAYLSQGRPIVQELFPSRLTEFDDSLDKQFFIYAVLHEKRSAAHAALAQQHQIPNLRYEDLTTSKEHLRQLVNYVCGDTLPHVDNWLSQDVTYKKANPHSGLETHTLEAVFKAWEPWQKSLYDYILQDKHFRLYSENNYYRTLI